MNDARSKVTSGRRVTLPREIADRYRIRQGDSIVWIPDGTGLRIVVGEAERPARLTVEERLRLFDLATERRDRRESPERSDDTAGRGWARYDLYHRDSS